MMKTCQALIKQSAHQKKGQKKREMDKREGLESRQKAPRTREIWTNQVLKTLKLQGACQKRREEEHLKETLSWEELSPMACLEIEAACAWYYATVFYNGFWQT